MKIFYLQLLPSNLQSITWKIATKMTYVSNDGLSVSNTSPRMYLGSYFSSCVKTITFVADENCIRILFWKNYRHETLARKFVMHFEEDFMRRKIVKIDL